MRPKSCVVVADGPAGLSRCIADAERVTPRLSVTRMQIHLLLRPGQQSADAKLAVLGEDHFVHREGVVVREPWPGWVVSDGPPLRAGGGD
jgi:hypothetical protein